MTEGGRRWRRSRDQWVCMERLNKRVPLISSQTFKPLLWSWLNNMEILLISSFMICSVLTLVSQPKLRNLNYQFFTQITTVVSEFCLCIPVGLISCFFICASKNVDYQTITCIRYEFDFYRYVIVMLEVNLKLGYFFLGKSTILVQNYVMV